jgi:DNA-binding MarR family transcriptional regulator
VNDEEIAELAGGLRTAVNRLAHVLRAPVAQHGVTPTRLTALATLEKHGPLRPGELADRMSISAASMSRLTEVLLNGGWADRKPDSADRRAFLLSLSAHGAATLDELRRESTGQLADALRALPEEQQRALTQALPVLTAIADRRLGDTPRKDPRDDHASRASSGTTV